jgi:hypothetical protein
VVYSIQYWIPFLELDAYLSLKIKEFRQVWLAVGEDFIFAQVKAPLQ